MTTICLRDLEIGQQRSLTEKLCELSRQAYPDCTERDLGSPDYWMGLADYDFCFAVLVDEEPVAYLDFLVLSPAGEAHFFQHEMHDGELDTSLFQKPGTGRNALTLYGASVVVAPEYRGQGLVRLLFDAARKHFVEHGHVIEMIYCTVWSPEGASIVKKCRGTVCDLGGQDHQRFCIIPEGGLIPFNIDNYSNT